MQEIHHFFHSLFSLTLDFRVRLFNILALGGTVISLIMALLSLGTGSWGNVLINLVLVAVSGGLFLYSYYSEKYQRCYLITIVMIFLIVFPVMFFTSGGYHGGMPAFFVFAISFYRADAGKKTGSDRFSAGDYPIYRTVSGRIPFSAHCNSFCHGSRPAGPFSCTIRSGSTFTFCRKRFQQSSKFRE